MVFDKNVNREQIEMFEKENLEKVKKHPLFCILKQELRKRSLHLEINVQRTESDLQRYLSHLVIDIFDENGERVGEWDEPNTCLMICEPICFKRRRNIVGIDLCKNEDFLENLNQLVNQVGKAICKN